MFRHRSQIWQIMTLFHILYNGRIFLLKYLAFLGSLYLCWNIYLLLHINYLKLHVMRNGIHNSQKDSFSIHSWDITVLHHASVSCVYSLKKMFRWVDDDLFRLSIFSSSKWLHCSTSFGLKRSSKRFSFINSVRLWSAMRSSIFNLADWKFVSISKFDNRWKRLVILNSPSGHVTRVPSSYSFL